MPTRVELQRSVNTITRDGRGGRYPGHGIGHRGHGGGYIQERGRQQGGSGRLGITNRYRDRHEWCELMNDDEWNQVHNLHEQRDRQRMSLQVLNMVKQGYCNFPSS